MTPPPELPHVILLPSYPSHCLHQDLTTLAIHCRFNQGLLADMSDYLEFFDFDAFPDSDEYTLDFQDLGNLYPTGGEEQNFAPNATLPPLLDATTALVEP